jgi:hypothetical protein
MSRDRRICPVRGCSNVRAEGTVTCKRCWRRVPVATANEIRRLYLEWQRSGDYEDHIAHLGAIRQAIRALSEPAGEPPRPTQTRLIE